MSEKKTFKYHITADYTITAYNKEEAELYMKATKNSLEWSLNNVEFQPISDNAPQRCDQQRLETPTAVTCQTP